MSFLRRLRHLFRRQQSEADMAEEMRFHLEARTADQVADGLSPQEAHFAARRKFGNLASIQEQARESTLWAYRATDGPVWFDFHLNKSPKRPTQLLENYRGLLQTDGARALDAIGRDDGRVIHLGC